MSGRSQARILFVTDSEDCSLEFVTIMDSLGSYECSSVSWAEALIQSAKKELTFWLQTTCVMLHPPRFL